MDPEYILDTTEIVTLPYTKPLGPVYPRKEVEAFYPTYNSLDVFIMKTRLRPLIFSLSPDYDLRFVSKLYKGHMQLCVEIFSGTEFIPITPDMAVLLQSTIDDIQKIHPRHCTLIDYNVVIEREGVKVPKHWLSSVIPFIAINDKYSPIHLNGQLLVQVDMQEDWYRLNKNVSDLLYKMYRDGVVPVKSNSQLIGQWNLQQYIYLPETPSLSELRVRDDYGLDEQDLLDMTPLLSPQVDGLVLSIIPYTNRLFLSQPVEFLLQRLAGQTDIHYTIPTNNVIRHHIAQGLNRLITELPHLQYKFYHDKVIVSPITDVRLAMDVYGIIQETLSNIPTQGQGIVTLTLSGVNQPLLDEHNKQTYLSLDFDLISSQVTSVVAGRF